MGSKRKQMNIEYTTQHSLITDLTASAMESCEKKCVDVTLQVKGKVFEKCTQYVDILTKQLDDQEKRKYDDDFNLWEWLNDKISNSHGQLIQNNGIVIKKITKS